MFHGQGKHDGFVRNKQRMKTTKTQEKEEMCSIKEEEECRENERERR